VWLVYVISVYEQCTGSAVRAISVDVVQCLSAVQCSSKPSQYMRSLLDTVEHTVQQYS
jgi:hypothetical protein